MTGEERHKDNYKHIVALIEATLDYHNYFKEQLPDIEKMYGTPRFRRSCQTVTISLPRQFGHTTAALEILTKYPNSILIVDNSSASYNLRKENIPLSDRIVYKDNIKTPHIDAIRVLAALRKNIDFAIIDTAKVTEDSIDQIFAMFAPKLLILLGDSEIKYK